METNTIHNVIILDKSGSMSSIAKPAITGVNETLAMIRSQEQKAKDEGVPATNSVTLVAFCGCETKVIYDNVPIAETHDITEKDYQPCCMTPLFDAVGNTITRIHRLVEGKVKDAVSVTIITDGYENASREFSGKAIKALIEAYKAEGWLFAYIGTDHDVEAVAEQLSVDNAMMFDKSAAGTKAMFSRSARSLASWGDKLKCMFTSEDISDEDAAEAKRKASEGYFD